MCQLLFRIAEASWYQPRSFTRARLSPRRHPSTATRLRPGGALAPTTHPRSWHHGAWVFRPPSMAGSRFSGVLAPPTIPDTYDRGWRHGVWVLSKLSRQCLYSHTHQHVHTLLFLLYIYTSAIPKLRDGHGAAFGPRSDRFHSFGTATSRPGGWTYTYRARNEKIDFLFCSGDHSRPFWLSKISFLVSKSRNFMKFCKFFF